MKQVVLLSSIILLASSWGRTAEFVVVVTVDGLRSSVFSELTAAQIPNFTRLRNEGVFTLNARTDYDWTYTNPNHVSILTARRVTGQTGHNYTNTGGASAGTTLHSNRGFYLTSIFDIAHDRGRRTGAFVTKQSQFAVIDASYTATTGAPDATGEDNGRDKIDVYHANNYGSPAIMDLFVSTMSTAPCHLSWVHFADPDDAGHRFGWSSPNYRAAVIAVDGHLGRMLDLFATDSRLSGRTTMILTADHGGSGFDHDSASLPANYTIPFMAWGAGVPRPGDLYALNYRTRRDPRTFRPVYGVPAAQPIRNIDAGNLALMLLGLPAIPDNGAFVNQAQDLQVGSLVIETVALENGGVRLEWSSLGAGYGYRVERATDLVSNSWTAAPGAWPITGTSWLDAEPAEGNRFYRVVAVVTPPSAAATESSSTRTGRSVRRSPGKRSR